MTEIFVPPHSMEAEQAVIGGLMLDNSRWDEVADLVGVDDFMRFEHREIWSIMGALVRAGRPIDVVTLSDELGQQGSQKSPLAYLGTLAKDTPSAANIIAYAQIVRERAIQRRALAIASDLYEAVHSQGTDAVDDAIRELMNLAEHRREYDCDLAISVRGAVDHLDELYHSSSPIVGIPSGLTDLDANLGGFHSSDLIVLAGRPAMGKTAVMMRFALSAGAAVGIISAEQPREQLGLRYLAQVGRISVHRMRRARIQDEDWPKITNAVTRLQDYPVHVFDRPAPTIDQVERQARKWAHNHSIQALYIDYIQKLRGGDGEKRHERVGDVVQRLKNLARELDIPVIALSQVSREVEKRPNKRPHMGDVSDSSEIEKEADVVALLYRDEVYNEESPDKGLMEVMIDKNRHGPVGSFRAVWLPEYMVVENYTAMHEQNVPESYKDRAAGD